MSEFVAFAPAEWDAVTAWLRVPGAPSRALLIRDGKAWVVRGVREGPRVAAPGGRRCRFLTVDLDSAELLPDGRPVTTRSMGVALPAWKGD